MSRERSAKDVERAATIDYVFEGLNRVAYEWARTGIQLMRGASNRCGDIFLNATEVLLSNPSRTDVFPCRRLNRGAGCAEELTADDREAKSRSKGRSASRRASETFADRGGSRRFR
jgi:hypothetical protein